MVFGGMEQFQSTIGMKKMQCNTTVACGDSGSDGTGSVILCDEDFCR